MPVMDDLVAVDGSVGIDRRADEEREVVRAERLVPGLGAVRDAAVERVADFAAGEGGGVGEERVLHGAGVGADGAVEVIVVVMEADAAADGAGVGAADGAAGDVHVLDVGEAGVEVAGFESAGDGVRAGDAADDVVLDAVVEDGAGGAEGADDAAGADGAGVLAADAAEGGAGGDGAAGAGGDLAAEDGAEGDRAEVASAHGADEGGVAGG